MVVIRFNQGVPKVTVWCIAHFVQHLEAGIDWVTQFCRCYEVINRKFHCFISVSRKAESLAVLNFQNSISFICLSPTKRYFQALPDRNLIEGRTLRKVFLKHKAKLFLFYQFVCRCLNLRPQLWILYFLNQFIQCCHISISLSLHRKQLVQCFAYHVQLFRIVFNELCYVCWDLAAAFCCQIV